MEIEESPTQAAGGYYTFKNKTHILHPFAAATVVWCVLPEAATFPPAVNSHTQVEFTSIDLTAFLMCC